MKRSLKNVQITKTMIEMEKCRRWVDYFISNYITIEDKTSPTGISLFNLWPKQREVLQEFLKNQFIIILKARQLGLTWLTLAYTLWRMMFQPGYTAIAISKRDDPDAKELSKRMQLMLKYLPDWMIREYSKQNRKWGGLLWEGSSHEVVIKRPNGEASRFLTLPASPDTAHSFTASLVILDEWALHPFADEIWTGAFPTMNRPGFSGQVIGLSTGRRGTLFEEIWNAAVNGENRFKPIFLDWRADPRRTDEWYEDTKRNLPKTYQSQYPATPEDAFTVGEGAFFEEWDEKVHVVDYWEPPKDWAIIGAYDPGFSTHACFKWYAVSPEGWARCFREYYPHRVTDHEQAEEIKRMSVYSDGTPMQFEYIVADTDAWTPSRETGRSTAEVFAEYGLYLTPANKDVANGWRRLHEWLKPFVGPDGKRTALLTFTKNCINTRRTYPACIASRTNPEDIDKSCEHHPQDVDRYFVMSRPEPKQILKKDDLDNSLEAKVKRHLEKLTNQQTRRYDWL